jgi:hypothetical protein
MLAIVLRRRLRSLQMAARLRPLHIRARQSLSAGAAIASARKSWS